MISEEDEKFFVVRNFMICNTTKVGKSVFWSISMKSGFVYKNVIFSSPGCRKTKACEAVPLERLGERFSDSSINVCHLGADGRS